MRHRNLHPTPAHQPERLETRPGGCAAAGPGSVLMQVAPLLILSLFLAACDGISRTSSPQLPLAGDSVGSSDAELVESKRSTSSYAIESDGSTIYLGSGPELLVLNSTDPGQLRLLARLDLPGIVRDLDLGGALLGAACGEGGFVMIDVADRSRPRILAGEVIEDRVEGLALAPGRVIVAARSAGVLLFDISDPSRPRRLGRLETDEQALHLREKGGLVFVAASFGGMRVLDVSDPVQPREIGFADRGGYDMGNAVDVAVDGSRAYVANEQIGLRVVDITKPDEPSTRSIYPLLHAPSGIAAEGPLVFVADQDQGLQIVDVSDPSRPKGLAKLAFPGRAADLVLVQGTAYIAAAEGGVWVADIRNSRRPRTIGSYMVGQSIVALDARGDILALADRLRGIRVFDGLHSGRLRERVAIPPGTEQSLFVGDDRLAASQGERLKILDLSDPGAPRQVAEMELHGVIRALSLAENHLLLVASERGLQLVDLSSPASPRTLGALTVEEVCGSFPTGDRGFESPVFSSTVWGVTGSARNAFVACEGGMTIVDLADPSKPGIRGRIGTPERVLRTEVASDRAFLSCDDGVRIVEITDSSMPREIGHFRSPGFVRGTALRDHRLFVIDLDAGLLVLDVSDPSRPSELVQLGLSHRPLALKLAYPYLSIATGSGGLEIFDVSDPLAPSRLQSPD